MSFLFLLIINLILERFMLTTRKKYYTYIHTYRWTDRQTDRQMH